MSDRDALFAAILAHPDEDTPRLMFADWLDENGDADHAAFIRKQIELSRVPKWDPLWVRAWYQDRDAITGRGFTRIQPALREGLSWPITDSIRRGFAWHVGSAVAQPFVTHADHLFRSMPLQALTVNADPDRWREPIDLAPLVASRHLSRLTHLAFSLTTFATDTTRQLRECPHLTNLRSLTFKFATLNRGAGRECFKSPLIERLETLEFEQSVSDWPELAGGILDANGPHRLRRFHFDSFTLSTFSHNAVFAAPLWRGLRELSIGKTAFHEQDMHALCEAPFVPQLESLSLNQVTPGVSGIKVLAGCAAFGNLKSLDLTSCRLGPVAIKALARSPHLRSLQVLNLGGNKLGDKGAIELARSPWIKNLVALNLMHGEVEDSGAEALADALDPEKLIRLDLYHSFRHEKLSDPVMQKLRDKFGNRVAL